MKAFAGAEVLLILFAAGTNYKEDYLKLSFTSICILAGILSFIACSEDDNSFAHGGENEYGTDYVVEYYDNLSVCVDERQDETAYVKERKKVFVCEDGKWHPIDEKGTKSSSSRGGSSGKDVSSSESSSSKANSSSSAAESSSATAKSSSSLFVATTSMLVDYCKWYDVDTCEYDSFTDSRDSNVYKTVAIGWQVWMAENLRYDSPGSKCSGSLAAGCSAYGKHYPCSEKDSVCPEGWKLPSTWDYAVLGRAFLGGMDSAGLYLKTSKWKIGYGYDRVGFSWEPLRGSGSEGAFWTVTDGDHEYVYSSENIHLSIGRTSDTSFYPIRCIKE